MDKLQILCFFGAVLGMLSLLAIASSIKPFEKSIDEISDSDVGRQVIVRGSVRGISKRNGDYFFQICKTKCLSVAIFRRMATDINAHSTDLSDLKTGNRVSIAGVITSYKDSLSLRLLDYNSLQVESK
jgi:hypothetical protein